jgi:hypothetical protein
VKRSRYVTATDIAECCVCEQRVVLDHLRGKRRTAASRRLMCAGTAAHAELHREALREMPMQAGDARWLLKRGWGPAATRLYYRLSPRLVSIMVRAPWLRAVVDRALSGAANRVAARHE